MLRSKYDTLVRAHGPDALAGVKNKSCQGCRTGLSQQRLNELLGTGVLICTTCGKMLYPAE